MSTLRTREDKIMGAIAHAVLILLSVLAVIPFWLLIASSLSDEAAVLKNGYSFLPDSVTLTAYKYIFDEWAQIGHAYGITIIVTVVGTVASLLMVTAFSYGMTKTRVRGIRLVFLLVVVTMLFNGGIVSQYFIYSNVIHIKDTIFALIVPNLMMSAFNVVLIKNYIRTNIPGELMEAAEVDGAGQFLIFFRIVIPLSTPIMATIGLLSAIAYWNDWNNGLYYITKTNLYSVQMLLNKMNEQVSFLQSNSDAAIGMDLSQLPSSTMRMAIAVVAILPILVIYPFFQKYFAKGITMGSIKG